MPLPRRARHGQTTASPRCGNPAGRRSSGFTSNAQEHSPSPEASPRARSGGRATRSRTRGACDRCLSRTPGLFRWHSVNGEPAPRSHPPPTAALTCGFSVPQAGFEPATPALGVFPDQAADLQRYGDARAELRKSLSVESRHCPSFPILIRAKSGPLRSHCRLPTAPYPGRDHPSVGSPSAHQSSHTCHNETFMV